MRALQQLLGIFGIVGTFLGLAPASAELTRLDPHGTRSAALAAIAPGSLNECKVCHVGTSGWKTLKPEVSGSCSSCHGRTPHSGVAEHVGRDYRGAKLDCLSCHSPHRADGHEAPASGGSLVSPERKDLDPAQMVQKPASFAMLRRNCQECHSWK
ncbi:MAG: hypothetical protein NDJ89_10180 [Oligoflexia bacterium]|nr:hypothetical protein [Oligoflexia bacterium]